MWLKAMCKELGRLTQGCGGKELRYHTKGTNTIYFLDHKGISKIPHDRVVTHARTVVDYCACKKDSQCARITAGENQLKGMYPDELTIRMSNLTTSIFMWNSCVHRRKEFLPCNPTGIIPVHEISNLPYTPGIH